MKGLRRSIPLAVLAAIGLTAGVLQSASAAGQEPAFRPAPRPPVISVDVTTAGGFSLPSSIHAGLVTFRISSPEDGHAIQGFSLKNGATLDQAMNDIDLVLGGDHPTVVAALKNLYHDVTEVGGIFASTYAPQEVTIPLTAGTYYFIDLNDIDNPPLTPRIHALHVHGAFQPSTPPMFTSVITGTMMGDMPMFVAPTRLRHDATFLDVVTGDELHESVFRPTVPGTTDAYITQFYDAFEAGTPLPPSPWTGIQAGLQAMSPGRWAIVHIDLPPGPYALICYVPSDENGVPHGHMGMHQTVTLY